MKIVFFGTPQFAAHVLQYLIDHKVDIVAVVSKPDKPKGRSGTPQPTPVKLVAQNFSLPIFQPELASSLDFAETLKKYDADLFVVVAYGEIVKKHLLDMPKLGCINLHASLLPKYRGAAPIHHCLINGDEQSGVTIMHMVKKMDAGDIIEMQAVPINENTTLAELEKALCEAGTQLLFQVIQDFQKGVIKRIPQDHDNVTFASRVELEDCEIYWNQSSEKIHNLIRGTSPVPGAWCTVKVKGQQKRLKIYGSRLDKIHRGKPGELLDPKILIVGCGEGALQLTDIQLEGKKRMSAGDFLRGVNPQDILFF